MGLGEPYEKSVLYTLFTDNRTPIFNAAYKVYRWDWTCNCRGGPILKWAVTLLGMKTTPGEIIRLPVAGLVFTCLVFSTWGLPKTWWVEVGTWRTQQLALPKGAEVISWVTPPE